MAELKPFEMVNYSPDYSDVLSNLITPPYDVISPKIRNSFTTYIHTTSSGSFWASNMTTTLRQTTGIQERRLH
jgi:hypothetical protein